MKQLLHLDKTAKSDVLIQENNIASEIAVIGIGLRIGDCFSPADFWEALLERRDFITPASPRRKKDTKDIIPTRGHDFLELAYMQGYDLFDNAFFKIPPYKASLMDPQEKILLQAAVQAVEDAGYGGEKLSGTDTGVFIGGKGSFSEYEKALAGVTDSNLLLELLTPDMTAARISHFMNLKGPALVLETACSSSLAALHTACRALTQGDCSLALAGACKLVLAPLARGDKTEIESADGRTRAFDRCSAGTGGGEACVIVLLKPVKSALQDRDSIYALIKGSAMNQNGAAASITAPDALSQASAIRSAWQSAGIDPARLSFVEAHGTGTRLGDVVEIEGLTRAFRNYTQNTKICPVGSVKSNAGHTDNAAGLLSFVKAVLSIRHRVFPGTVHFQEPNPKIDFENGPVYPTAENTVLGQGVLSGGISSFGLSGTNVHTVVQSPPEREHAQRPKPPYIFALSARSEDSIQGMLKTWAGFSEQTGLDPADISYTLTTGRGHYEHRLAFLYNDTDQLSAILNRLISGEMPEAVLQGVHTLLRDFRQEKTGGIPAKRAEELGEEMRARLADGQLQEALQFYVSGARADFTCFFNTQPVRRVHLPVYPFEPIRNWFNAKKEGRFSFFEQEDIRSGRYSAYRSVAGSFTSWVFNEHSLGGKKVLPASSLLDQAFDLAHKTYGDSPKIIKDLRLHRFFEIPDEPTEIVVNVHPAAKGRRCVVEYLFGGEWRTAAEWMMQPADGKPASVSQVDVRKGFPEQYASREDFKPSLNGVQVSDKWRCLEYAGEGRDGSACILSVAPEHQDLTKQYFCYPPLGDIATNFPREAAGCTPLAYSRIEVFASLPEQCLAFSRLKKKDERFVSFDVKITDNEGRVLVNIEDYTMLRRSGTVSDYYHLKEWVDAGPFAPDQSGEPVFLLYDGEARPVDNTRNARAFCRAERSVLIGIKNSRNSDASELAREFYSSGLRRIVYMLPEESRQPEETLERLFLFLSGLASQGDSALELIIAGRKGSSLLHSSAAGMGRVLELERPLTRFRFVSIENESAAELFSLFSISGFRLRLAKGRVQRQQLTDGEAGTALSLRQGGRYLITGGLGGLGMVLAEYISERTKGDIVLVSRSGFPPEEQWDHLLALGGRSAFTVQALRRIKETGCRVKILAANVSSRKDMLQLREQFGGFDGVFHFAGTAEDKFLNAGDRQGFGNTLAPKIRGSINVTELFAESRFIVLSSSLSALTGAPGQAGYVAANAFMDSLAEQSGKPGVYSLGWPKWAETGMAVDAGGPRDESFASIDNSEAALCLDHMPQTGYTAVGKSTEPNNDLLLEGTELRFKYFAPKADEQEETVSVSLSGAEEFSRTQRIIGAIWGQELGYDALDIYDEYEILGGDSITFLGIHEKLQNRFNLEISLNNLFERQTVFDMALYIDSLLFIQERSQADRDENTLLLREDGEQIIFCFPPGTSYGYAYYDMARLADGFTFYAFNYVSSDSPPEILADMLESVQPDGELVLLGYSIGGNLAYETARVLESRGRKIQVLIFLDNYRRLELFHFTDQEYRKNAEDYLIMVDDRYLRSENRERILTTIEHYNRYMDSRMEAEQLNAPIHLIKGEDEKPNLPYMISQEAWGELTTEFVIHQGSGKHLDMLSSEHLKKNVDLVKSILLRFRGDAHTNLEPLIF